MVFFCAASMGITFLINNVLHIGEALALGAGETVLAAAVFSVSLLYRLRLTKRKGYQNDACRE